MRSENQTRNTRRTFLKSTGAVAAGLCLTRTASAGGKSLAVNGGTKAVTASHEDASTWPRYGAEEEHAVLELVRKPNYGPIEALEKEWKQHFSLPYCKAHYNGTSAITAMFFALDLPAGSEIMVPCSTFWATIMHIFPEARDKLAGHGLGLHYLATWRDVLKVARDGDYFDTETLAQVEQFLNEPLNWSAEHGGKSEISI